MAREESYPAPQSTQPAMTATELLWLNTVGETERMIAYRPNFRKMAGSITAAILLQQILYRWKSNNYQPFYKYKEECDAPDYRPGDSWCEELAFSRSEFDSALKAIGQKVSRKAKRDDGKFVWYWTMPDRKTWYEINFRALCNAGIPLYVNTESRATQSGIPAIDIPYTKNTSETTTKSSARVSPSRDRDAPPTQPTPTHARAVALAESESFDGPATPKAKATTPPPLTRRQMKQRSGPYFKQSLVREDFIPGGAGENAVQIYFERFSPYEHRLTSPQQDDMVRAVKDLALWREVVTAWDQSGHKPTNIKGMLDWYSDPTRISGRPTNGHVSKGSTNGATKEPTPQGAGDYEWYSQYGANTPVV
jgi:hypothetical protein